MTRRTYTEVKIEDVLKTLAERDRRLIELEEKIEDVLRQNGELRAENARLKYELLKD